MKSSAEESNREENLPVVPGEDESGNVAENATKVGNSCNSQSDTPVELSNNPTEREHGDDLELTSFDYPEATNVTEAPAKESFIEAASSKALRPFVIISSSYLLFTITDGAIRMIVLWHAYNKNFSAIEVSVMFTLYELAGVFTNLVS